MKTIVPCVQMDTCLFHCTLFIYMEMKWCSLKPYLSVFVVQQGQWKEIRIACVLGTFVEAAFVTLFEGKRKGALEKRCPVSHGSQNSHFGEQHFFFSFEKMIGLLVCSVCKDKKLAVFCSFETLLKKTWCTKWSYVWDKLCYVMYVCVQECK